jgi:16S rRNA processing protein RimM
VGADVHLGVVVKPVGLRGEVKLRQSADFWDAALASSALRLDRGGERRPVQVRSWRPQGPGLAVLQLADVGDRDAALSVCGADLWLAAGADDVAAPDGLRPFQVRGLRVERVDGTAVGVVADLLPMPAQPVLVVRDGDREHLVPCVPAIVVEVDRDAGVVRIDPPEGLLELGT